MRFLARKQEGSLKGRNPRRHGRSSHHPLLAVLGEAHFLLHGWLRSGNCGTARGAEELLKEALTLWGQRQKIRLLRADSGFFDGQLLDYLEQHDPPYIVVAKLTKWVRRAAQRVETWTALDEHYGVGEFRLKLFGWSVERRFVVIREEIREARASVGRKLIDVPGYTFRLFITKQRDPGFQSTPTFRQMDNHATAGATEHCAACENLCANRGRFAIACQAGRNL